MNEASSHELARGLQQGGYAAVETPAQAELVIVNTCSVREKAESRAMARIKQMAALKKNPPRGRPVVWVVGCMAERLGESVKEEVPGVDRVIGAPQLEFVSNLLPQWCAQDGLDALCSGGKDADAWWTAPGQWSVYVPVMRGCDNYCAYCIVPYVRGREHSRPVRDIHNEIQRFVRAGAREVTLLGQNVNSYAYRGHTFADLLRQVHAIEGLVRIRFTTSHPKDCSDRLIRTVAELPKCCAHIHLPVQSGSDRILTGMNRKYTRAQYLERIERIRSLMPRADITTDVMVGFPGETHEDFEQTLSLFETVRFTDAFMFAYSPRPGTRAASMTPEVQEEEKKARLSRLIELQTEVTRMYYSHMVNTEVALLPTWYTRDREGRALWKCKDYGAKNAVVYTTDSIGGTLTPCSVVDTTGKTLVCERI
jgi:tRNA-2-methylthio-N6-dimethylallyladenosine synthase